MTETTPNLFNLGFDYLRHRYGLVTRTEIICEDATAEMNTAASIEHGGTNGMEACIESARSKEISTCSKHVNSTAKFRTPALVRRNGA